MGYTHFWHINRELQNFPESCVEDIKKLYHQHREIIQRDYDDSRSPVANKNLICFNGIGEEEGHETFLIELPKDDRAREDKDGYVFGFCKTQMKPYDEAVMQTMLILKHHLKEDIRIGSNGDFETYWENAFSNVRATFGYSLESIIDEEKE